MSEIRSLGVTDRIKRAAVASGLALATISWLGVSAMPAAAFEPCTGGASGNIIWAWDDGSDADLFVGEDGILYVYDGSDDIPCTADFAQTKKVKTIQLGDAENRLEDVSIDLNRIDKLAIDIEVWVYDDYDFEIYTSADDPNGASDIWVGGGDYDTYIEYDAVDVHVDNDGYFYDFTLGGPGDKSTITCEWDGSVYDDFYIYGDYEYDYGNDDVIDASGCITDDSLHIEGDDGDDTIIGSPEDDDIYGEDGFDTVTDGSGDDYVEANWNDAGAKAQGQDQYYEEDDDQGLYIVDYSARTRDLVLISNSEWMSGEVGENDYIDQADSYTDWSWLLAGSGNDDVSSDTSVNLGEFLQGGAGTNTIDCYYEDAAADYEFSPNAVTVDLAAGTATGWGTDTLIGCDWAVGSAQGDTLTGDNKDNTLWGEGFVGGGAGDDTINGGSGDDSLEGEGGSDTVNGDGGDDYVNGGDGTDTLNGGDGDDCMGACDASEDGNDSFDGGAGDDDMYGGNGEDRVFLSAGDDFFDGDAGRNVVDGSKLESKVRIDLQFGEAAWDGWTTELDNTVDAVGSPFADRIVAWPFGTGDEYIGSKISGGAGNDDLIGLNGPDQLRGNAGDDVIRAGAGSDNLRGGAGDDELWGGAGVDAGNGGAGSDVCKSVERAKNCSATGMAKVQLNSRI